MFCRVIFKTLKELNELEKIGRDNLLFGKKRKLDKLKAQFELDNLHKKLVKNGKLSFEDAEKYKSLHNLKSIGDKFKVGKIEDTIELEGKTKNIFEDIKPREPSKWDKNIDEIKETKHSTINNKKYINRTNESQEAIDEMVERQKLTGYHKELAEIWSGDANISMNQSLNGEEIDLRYGTFSSVSDLERHVDDLIDLIDNMPKEKCIQDNTLFFRGIKDDRIDLSMFIPGSKPRKLKTFTSTTYDVDVASDFAEYTDPDGAQGWILKVHTPKGTKGVALNEDVTTATEEYEYLLSPNQKYITHVVDEENKIIEIELVN